MNVRLGVYELFSRIVPGGLYIAAIVQLLMILGVLKFDVQSVNEISLVASIGLVLVAYTVGGAFDIFSLAWFRLFEQRGVHSRMFATFKNSCQDRWEIDFTASDCRYCWHSFAQKVWNWRMKLIVTTLSPSCFATSAWGFFSWE